MINIFREHVTSFLVACIILAAIPLTIITAQNQQILTQQASGPTPSIAPPTPSPTVTEKRRTINGKLVEKKENSFTLEDNNGTKTTVNFIPNYTKIYQPPSAAEYSPTDIPLGIFMTGTALILPKERSRSGNEELIGEIFRLPVNAR